MRVVILAAGMGSRLKEILNNKPKPLFEVLGKSLLEYSLEALKECGINEVTIVIGYNGHFIREKIGDEFKGIRINYVVNNNYQKTGSMHSVYVAFHGKEPEDCIVLDADLVYDPKFMREFIESEKKDAAFLTTPCGSGDETFVILDEEDNKISYLRLKRNEDPKLVEGKELWEFNGVAKFSKEFMEEMIKLHEEKLNGERADEYYEENALEVHRNKMPWYGFVNSDFVLAEVDRPKDVILVNKLLEKIKKVS